MDKTKMINFDSILDSDGFVKIFSHDTSGGVFRSKKDALRKNSNNPDAKLFSILDALTQNNDGSLTKIRDEQGKFHFKICFPELKKSKWKGKKREDGYCNEWLQSSNPVEESVVTGFQALDLLFSKDGGQGPWRGLGKGGEEDIALIDDTGAEHYYWMAVGATKTTPYYGKDAIPGPWLTPVKQVELYVKSVS